MPLLLMLFVFLLTPHFSAAKDTRTLPAASDITAPIVNYNHANEKLATAGEPSLAAFKELADKGITTFIDLRTDEEELAAARTVVTGAGAQYHSLPVVGSEGITQAQVDAFTTLYEQSEGPILLSCKSGNRVGALWTAYQLSKGVPHPQAIAQGEKAGMGIWLKRGVLSRFCESC